MKRSQLRSHVISGYCVLDQMEALIEFFSPPESQQSSLEEQRLEELSSIMLSQPDPCMN